MLAISVFALLSSASAAAVVRTDTQPLLALRGGAYPPPKAGYHALAAKGAAATKMAPIPNFLSGSLAGCYVAFGAILSMTVASALGDVVGARHARSCKRRVETPTSQIFSQI